ncbi:MAG: TonB-dependent receptor, partial [Pseudomonadota bacterium]
GSRLNQANLSSPSPVFQVNAAEVDQRGTARLEDLLNVLPQTLPAQGSALANGATVKSTVDLRGLGSQRTLVLVDGKRLPYGLGQGTGIGANIDFVPAQLVEGIDIVTGGASAVYGSDAIAGVVNFKLKKDFEGLELDGQVGFFQDGNGGEFANEILDAFGQPAPDAKLDGRGVNISALWGANTADGRGNVTAFIQYQDQNEIRQADRDYSACAYGGNTGPNNVGGVGCVGSSTFRSIGPFGSDPIFVNPDGSLATFTNSAEQTFNFAPDNFIQRNNERFNFSASARYELTDGVEAYVDLGYLENQTDSQIAFTGTFFRTFQINCDNPFLNVESPNGTGPLNTGFFGCTPDQIANGEDVGFGGVASGPGYRNVTGDPRSTFIDIDAFRGVVGLRGTIADRWDWDVFGQFSRTNLNTVSTGDINFQRMQDAFFVVEDDTGTPVCRSGNAGCTPVNFFTNPTGELISPEQAQFLQGTGIVRGQTEQIVLGGTIGGETGVTIPWAQSQIQGLVGVEYRRDSLERTPDELSRIPGGLGLTGVGGGTLPVQGEVEVTEVYGEVQIPIIEGAALADELVVTGAYRFSDYSTDGNGVQNSFSNSTFAAGAAWAPVPDMRFRFQFQRAIRAPSVFDLFTGQNTGLFNGSEPCGPGTTFTQAQCANTGLPASLFGVVADNPAGQLNQVTGGNPLLFSETANTYTAGVVLQPRFIDGLTVSVDYYDISIDDAIGTIPAATSLNQCVTTGNSLFCDNVVRDFQGSLFGTPTPPAGSAFQFAGVQATNVNVANVSTRGLDINGTYSFDLDQIGVANMGSMSFNYAASLLFERSFIPVPGVTGALECSGLYRGNCGTTVGAVNPEYVHRFLTTWQTPWDVDVNVTWRRIGGTTFDEATSGSVNLSGGGEFASTGNVLDDFLDTANYVDLSLQWAVKDNLSMRAGVNNLLGRDPELTTEAGTAPGNGDTFPQFYDPAGRFIFVGFNWSL